MKIKNIGIYGLGKMGKNIALNMLYKGYGVVAYNRSEKPRKEVEKKGAIAVPSLKELVSKLKSPRVIWLMLPSGDPTGDAILELSSMLSLGDIIIDGSNSRYKDTVQRYKILRSKGIKMLDAGCSGGPSGALNGMCTMVGGDKEVYLELEGLFKDLSVKNGALYTGKSGSGHYVKMVHNAIEYGFMQSLAEGAELLDRGPYSDLDLKEIFKLWNNGSVIRSYLVELSARAMKDYPKLENVEPYVEDSGEGRWSVDAAVEYAIPLHVISSSLFERFNSRSKKRISNRLLAALRLEFGGHAIKTKSAPNRKNI